MCFESSTKNSIFLHLCFLFVLQFLTTIIDNMFYCYLKVYSHLNNIIFNCLISGMYVHMPYIQVKYRKEMAETCASYNFGFSTHI
jgi:hypothetical protein